MGSFVVRYSSTYRGDYTLSLRTNSDDHATGVAHYLIVNIKDGVKFKVKFCC